MKKNLVILLTLLSFSGFSQINKYKSKDWEFIFSFADYKVNNQKINTPVRFTCFFHYGYFWHMDFSKNFGIYFGNSMRNIGFTSSKGDTSIKRRTYTLGVPLAIKIGNMNKNTYLFAGAEAELAFHYKEKLFVKDTKVNKETGWFDSRTNRFLPSVFVGMNFKRGFNVKFRYYLEDFYNTSYTVNGVKPYANINSSRMYYFSVGYNIASKPAIRKKHNAAL